MPINTIGNSGEDSSDKSLNDVILGYEQRVNEILAAFIVNGIGSSKEHTLSIGSRVIDNFMSTLLVNSISPRHKEYIVEHGIALDANFQSLIMEVGTYNMITGTPERFLQLFLDNPEIFHSYNREYILQNSEIQSALHKRLAVLEGIDQRGFARMIRETFVNQATL